MEGGAAKRKAVENKAFRFDKSKSMKRAVNAWKRHVGVAPGESVSALQRKRKREGRAIELLSRELGSAWNQWCAVVAGVRRRRRWSRAGRCGGAEATHRGPWAMVRAGCLRGGWVGGWGGGSMTTIQQAPHQLASVAGRARKQWCYRWAACAFLPMAHVINGYVAGRARDGGCMYEGAAEAPEVWREG